MLEKCERKASVTAAFTVQEVQVGPVESGHQGAGTVLADFTEENLEMQLAQILQLIGRVDQQTERVRLRQRKRPFRLQLEGVSDRLLARRQEAGGLLQVVQDLPHESTAPLPKNSRRGAVATGAAEPGLLGPVAGAGIAALELVVLLLEDVLHLVCAVHLRFALFEDERVGKLFKADHFFLVVAEHERLQLVLGSRLARGLLFPVQRLPRGRPGQLDRAGLVQRNRVSVFEVANPRAHADGALAEVLLGSGLEENGRVLVWLWHHWAGLPRAASSASSPPKWRFS